MTGEAHVRIERLAAGGDGIGRLEDGRAVFVPRSAPGDLVRLTDVRLHRAFARARIGEIVEPSTDRVTPRCPHYDGDMCGGCQLQHVEEDAQRDARRGFVRDALRRIGGVDLEPPPLEPAPDAWGYRSRITLAVDASRRPAVIGYHRTDRPDRIFDLIECSIAAPALNALWGEVRAHRHLLPPDVDRVMLRLDRDHGRHVLLRSAGPRAWDGGPRLAAALLAAGQSATVWWQPAEGAARVMGGGPAGSAFPATVFEQVHPAMGDRARGYAIERLDPRPGEHVWDLYAGIGDATSMIRGRGATVESVEADPRAVRHAAEAAGGAGNRPPESGIERHQGLVEWWVTRLRPATGILTNPPRAGIAESVAAGIAASGASRFVYVSCDPATLARDLKRLGPAWRLADLRAFDLFPQTAHVETVATMERV